MTRRWLSVIAVFCGVLALAASASAECAWVLWSRATSIERNQLVTTLTPVTGFPTSQECASRASDLDLSKLTEDERMKVRALGILIARLHEPPRHRGPTRSEGEVRRNLAGLGKCRSLRPQRAGSAYYRLNSVDAVSQGRRFDF